MEKWGGKHVTNWMGNLLHWWNQRSMKGNFFRQSLIIVLCITSLPTAAVGFSAYLMGKKHIEQEVNRTQQVLLTKALQRMNDDLTHLELTATQWAFNPNFDQQLRDVSLKERYDITYSLYRSLMVMKGSFPLISEVYLFVNGPAPQIVSDTDGVFSIQKVEQQTQYQSLLTHNRGAFWLDDFPPFDPKDDSSIVLVHKLPGIGEPYGALIICLDKTKLVQLVKELSSDDQGGSFIVAEDGDFIVRGSTDPKRPTNFENALKGAVMHRASDTDAFLFSWENRTYSVSYGEFSRLGLKWKYVTATPLTQITQPVVIASRIILAISFMGLLIAAVLSWLASKRLYRPIRHLVSLFHDTKTSQGGMKNEIEFIAAQWRDLTRESEELHSKLQQAYPSLRAGFLIQLSQGHYYSLTEEELRQRMETFGWHLKDKGFVFILIQISGLSYPEGKFADTDEQLVTFAAANIAQEILGHEDQQADVINFQDLSLGILMTHSLTNSDSQINSDTAQLAQKLSDTFSSLLKVYCTCCIGRFTPNIKDIPDSLQSLRQAMRYRDLQADNQILILDELLPEGYRGVHYPFQLEKEIIHALRMGLRQESMRLIQPFIDELVHRSGKEKLVQAGVLQLLGSIQHTILETGYHPLYLYNGGNLYEQLHKMREPEKMVQWFQHKVIQPYLDQLTNDQDLKTKRLVEKVIDHLKAHLMADISLEQCASLFGVSHYTLSKAFKQITGVNFIDYITQLRIEKTKELLYDPSLKINDIAEKIGYRPSYLIRLFKKHEGVTPGQYREQLQAVKK
ncbi:helix-turn-helix domain-containing protein [Paenibacillus xerothermodurans]|uniref:AraC family transcriptional regulator n=1 Tax=Paenibacillus xerothermodurans TaxID=1977292 RepID=A0A2W1NUR1_PAEXE|nr:helix-turn-helix domain-containing protein [Paenibacillus xerothermodurans]PZE19422.1 AraC family transcriptional regulator [Paenibacillus xerothermodurans]